MDVAIIVSGGYVGSEHQRFGEDLRTFSAELEHFAHGGVTIDVGVRALDVGIFRSIGMRDGSINHHEVRFGFTTT